jgi:membrane peptidoglycan carboxypeptidase
MTRLLNTLRVLAKIFLAMELLCVLAVGGVVAWLYFYTSDLPPASGMAAYVVDSGVVSVPTTICEESLSVAAVPGANMPTLRLAVIASEGEPDPRGFFRRYYDALDRGPRYGQYSVQLARQMVCGSSGGNLKRELLELRTAIQLERRFSRDQLLDIYLNRAYFGPRIYGADEASRRYFGKHAGDLSIAEAALLAGLIKSPGRFSPTQHPDRELTRRNEVIDAMLQRGSIRPEEAEAAKQAPMNPLLQTK